MWFRREQWTLIKGAAKYAEAWARGDRKTKAESDQCAAKCLACKTRTDNKVPMLRNRIAGFCGKPGDEVAGIQCGCLVTFNGKPAGKTKVGSQHCPQFQW